MLTLFLLYGNYILQIQRHV